MSLDPHPSPAELRAMMARKGGAVVQEGTTQPRSTRQAPSVRPWGQYRSKWELEYAKHLELRRLLALLFSWDYEPKRFEIGVRAFYKPDFRVVTADNVEEWHEVKGYRREAAMVRIKAAAKQYPQSRFVLVTKKAGQWVHTRIGA